MTDAAKRILEAARKLSREERALVAAELRRDDAPQPSTTQWCDEVERRISDFDDDDAFEDAEEVYRKLVADLDA